MNSSSNGDVEVWAIMMALSLLLIILPFIPVVRSIPRRVGLYRIIWRHHYHNLGPEVLQQIPPERESRRR
jgi:hypothetical protein